MRPIIAVASALLLITSSATGIPQQPRDTPNVVLIMTTEGTRGRDHPLAVRYSWPARFEGSLAAFTAFTREVDIRWMLRKGEVRYPLPAGTK